MKNKLKVGSDFSGVGAFDQALIRLGIDYETVFSCDMDKYARQTYIHNYGEPKYYPKNVYDREIPKEPLTIFMTSPPCQSFSIAGKRKGKDSDNGILFFNSHEFIQQNKPRYFIFENVKGLLSDDNGKTFSEWCNMLGGKSINGMPVLFPYDNSVPYHIYHKVLNSKNFGVPQNRERVFIIGIRDDEDNTFTWQKEMPLEKRLKDLLEDNVDPKYYLSDLAVKKCLKSNANSNMDKKPLNNVSRTLIAGYYKIPFDGQYVNENDFRYRDQDHTVGDYRNDQGLRIRKDGISPCMTARKNSQTDISTMAPLIIQKSQDHPMVKTGKEIIYDEPLDKKGWHNKAKEVLNSEGISTCINTQSHNLLQKVTEPVSFKIRRLTPRECFRLQDFPDSFTWTCSDTQSYRQAGNSITVAVLAGIINKLILTN